MTLIILDTLNSYIFSLMKQTQAVKNPVLSEQAGSIPLKFTASATTSSDAELTRHIVVTDGKY